MEAPPIWPNQGRRRTPQFSSISPPHHSSKPWYWKLEAQEPSQEEKGKQPVAIPGGEGQAVRKYSRR
jgi:hypothetical protein